MLRAVAGVISIGICVLGLNSGLGQSGNETRSTSPGPEKAGSEVLKIQPCGAVHPLEGKVTIFLRLDSSGKPSHEVVVESSGDACTDREALEAVRRYPYKPVLPGKRFPPVLAIDVAFKAQDQPANTAQ